jgi:hypothetical protein
VVVRRSGFQIERGTITKQAGPTLTFQLVPTINPANGGTTGSPGTNGYGYFIQRDPRTLDELGEWYFDQATGQLRMFFGPGGPGTHLVAASAIDTLIEVGDHGFITVSDLTLQGANLKGIWALNASDLTVRDSTLRAMGAKGILVFNGANVTVDHVTVEDALCGAIDLTARHQNGATVTRSTTHNTAIHAGMGSFSDPNDAKAIYVSVQSTALVEHNVVDSSGYLGIEFQGSDVTIRRNLVTTSNFVHEDGGGIYTYADGTEAKPGTTYTNRVIDHNLIFDAIGATDGTAGAQVDVEGIYLDGRTMNVEVTHNTVVRSKGHGVYSNNPSGVRFQGNTVYDSGYGWGLTRYSWGAIHQLVMRDNIFFPKSASQLAGFYFDTGINTPDKQTIEQRLQALGDVDHNIYNTPSAKGFADAYALVEGGGYTFPPGISLEEWQAFSGLEKTSQRPPPSTEDLLRFEYNASDDPKTVNLGGQYLGPDGAVYDGSITLDGYTSAILIANGPATGTGGTGGSGGSGPGGTGGSGPGGSGGSGPGGSGPAGQGGSAGGGNGGASSNGGAGSAGSAGAGNGGAGQGGSTQGGAGGAAKAGAAGSGGNSGAGAGGLAGGSGKAGSSGQSASAGGHAGTASGGHDGLAGAAASAGESAAPAAEPEADSGGCGCHAARTQPGRLAPFAMLLSGLILRRRRQSAHPREHRLRS